MAKINDVQFIPSDMCWRHVPGYEGLYMVSNYGEVLRCVSVQENNLTSGLAVHPSLVMKQKAMKTGYKSVSLVKDKEPRMWLVHRLVAKAFLGAEDGDGLQVNHIDGDKTNNCVRNLELVTAKENIEHAILLGLRTRKVTDADMGDVIRSYLDGETQRSIAKRYGVHHQTINDYIKKYKEGEFEWLEA